MATLLETSAAVAASLDLDALLDQILSAVGRLVPSERASVTLDVPGRDVLKIVCIRGEPSICARLLGKERAIHGSLTGRAYRTGESFLIDDLLAAAVAARPVSPARPPDHHARHRSAMIVPLSPNSLSGHFISRGLARTRSRRTTSISCSYSRPRSPSP